MEGNQAKQRENKMFVAGRNAENVRSQATRVIKGKIPAQVRKELMDAVKAGYLGRLKKDGLKPEVFFNPNHFHGAVEVQNKEANYAISCVASVVSLGAEKAEHHYNLLSVE